MSRCGPQLWRRLRVYLAFAAALAFSHDLRADPPDPRATSTVGMSARIDQLVLPGSELEAKPLEDRREPLVLRITGVYPHGTSFRYDLEYYALEPGQYDLRDRLRRKDGSALGDLPSIPVTVNPMLPPGQVEPRPLALEQSPSLGGYRLLLAFCGSFWVAGLVAILVLGRRKPIEDQLESSRPATLADRLRPLVDAALAGTLSQGQHAELERLLIGYWRKRLELEKASPAEAIAVMRSHPEAGALLRKLEDWLHKPGAKVEETDLSALLGPYHELPDDVPSGEEN